MIVELGHFALVLALGMAMVQSILPLIGAWRRWPVWRNCCLRSRVRR